MRRRSFALALRFASAILARLRDPTSSPDPSGRDFSFAAFAGPLVSEQLAFAKRSPYQAAAR